MKRIYFYILCLLVSGGCSVTLNTPPKEPIGFNIEPTVRSIVIIDGGITTTTGMAIKKKREGVVKEVKNQYLVMLTMQFQKVHKIDIITDTTLSDEEKNILLKKDSTAIAGLHNKYTNSLILIIKDCYAGFRQDEVQKVTDGGGKSTTKVAQYSVFFDTDWLILQGSSIHQQTISAARHHSSRTVQSGLLARGPGFEANKKDITEMADMNALKVAQLFTY